MDKKTFKTLFIVIMGISFFVLLMSAWTLFSNFTIGKGAMDIATEQKDYIAKAGKIVYWFSGAGFFVLLPFIVGLIFTCFAKRRKVCLFTAIYGMIAFVAFVVLTAVANVAAYEDGEVLDEAYLLISALQVNLMQVLIPTALLVTGAFAAFAKCAHNSSANKADEKNEDGENKETEANV